MVLLHGFSGTHRAWDGVVAHLDAQRYLALAADLPGHGAATQRRPITFESCVRHVLERAPERFLLCGYSMGGRIALHVALAAPERVSRLVLIGADPGIEDETGRARRREADARQARELEAGPFEQWVERWRSQPLFAREPEHVRQRASADQLRNDPRALAAALRGIGIGEMHPLWDRLCELRMPVTLVVGTRDRKFSEIASRMLTSLPQAELVALDGGHGLVLERPAEIAAVLQRQPVHGSTPRPGAAGGAIAPSRTGSGSPASSNSASVASPQ